MRARLPALLLLPAALTGCPALLSDWTIGGGPADDASADAGGSPGATGDSGSGPSGSLDATIDAAAGQASGDAAASDSWPEATESGSSSALVDASTVDTSTPEASTLDAGPAPQTCAELAASFPAAADGTYTLYYEGDRSKPWIVYCVDLSSEPKEYLTLPGSETNFSQDFEGVTTSYSRVRFVVDLSEVDVSDERFAVTTGTVNTSGVPVTMAYATAASGNSAPSGTGMVDLTGTGFAVAPGAFMLGGFNPQGMATYSPSGQVVTLAGGGYGGWIGPVGLSNPFSVNVATGFLNLQWVGVP